MDGHVQILGADLGATIQLMGCFEIYPSTFWVYSQIQLVGCFEIYPSICWVSSQNMNVG
jgi:hypothetical protein